jgi:CBS domain containing-hemolysin-like protein
MSELGTDLAVDGIDTIGGLLFTKAGELPPAGRSFKIGQHLATIRKLSGKRIEEVLIERQAQKGDRL